MNKLPDQCPICKHELIVTEMLCGNCDTTISGNFELHASPLSRLDSKQLEFIITFIRCEGKFNRMEDELGFSYPTIKNRFNEIISVMGFASENLADAETLKEQRMEILRMLEEGEIDPGEAEIQLRDL